MFLDRAWRGVAIIYASERGRATAHRVRELLVGAGVPAVVLKYGDADLGWVLECFDAVVFVMALGGVVRSICGLLRRKDVDPPVVAVDDSARYAIPVVGGHWGGNELAEFLARGLGATAVITTAMESAGLPSVEWFARSLLARIVNVEAVAPISSALLRGERVCVVGVDSAPWPSAVIGRSDCRYVIYVGQDPPTGMDATTLWLRPMRLFVGVGAKSGVSPRLIAEAVERVLARLGVGLGRVEAIASPRREAEEAANLLGTKFVYVDWGELERVDYRCATPPSGKLRELGLRGVAELAALAAAGPDGVLILRKVPYASSITVAVAGR